MHRHRFSHLVIALLLVLDAPAASYAATVLYGETTGGLIYKSTDSAKTWQAVSNPTPDFPAGASSGLAVDPQNTNNLYAFFVTAALRGQAVPSQAGVNRSTDGGQSWTATALAPPGAPPLAIDATMSNIIYIVGNGGSSNQSWRSTDYGATFQAGTNQTFGKAIKTDPSQPGVVYLVGQAITRKSYRTDHSCRHLQAHRLRRHVGSPGE